MKKRFLSLVVMLCMVISMLPVAVHAEDPPAEAPPALFVGNTEVSTDSSSPIYWIEESGSYTYVKDNSNYLFSVSYDQVSSTYTLTLNGVDIMTYDAYCGIHTNGNLNIVLATGKTNSITVPGVGNTYYGIKANDLNISGGGTLAVTVNSDEKYYVKYGIFSNDGVTITDSKVSVAKCGRYGDAVYADKDIRILGDAQVTLVDWSKGEGVDCGLHSNNGNVAIGDSASVDICSQSKGIFARNNAYIGYVWDDTTNSGAGGYVVSGNPTVKINDAAAIAAITPETQNDFAAGIYGIYSSDSSIYIAGGNVSAAGSSITTDSSGIYAQNSVSITGGTVSVTGQNGIYSENGGIAILGSDTVLTVSTQGDEKIKHYGIHSGYVLTITDAKVALYQTTPRGNGLFANSDIRISGMADISVINWGVDDSSGFYCNEDLEVVGNIAIGGNAEINVCSQALGIVTYGSTYIGYVWDATIGKYVASGYPTVRINNEADVAAITPDTADDFKKDFIGFAGIAKIDMAGGLLETAGTEYAVVTIGAFNKGSEIPPILAAKYHPDTDDGVFTEVPIEAADLGKISWKDNTLRYNDALLTYIKMETIPSITKESATGGSFTVKVSGIETVKASAGDIVNLSAAPNSGYIFSSWNVFKTGDTSSKVTVTGNTFTMPAYPITIEAVFTTISSTSGGSYTPSKTITVTETSSDLFKSSGGQIKAEANMSGAFSDSVEVKVKDTAEKASNFGLGTGTDVFPFDISLYIKGTDTKTEPNNGYAVTISLPIPEKLLGQKEMLSIVHKADNGVVTTLSSKLAQNNGVWYLVFEANEFSPYALVLSKLTAYDESAGVPYYIDSKGKTVFIGFAANKKYLAPDGVKVLFKDNNKTFTDVNSHWAASNIDFVTEREIFIGVGTDTFSPETGMTRAMFATAIGRLYERSYGEINTSAISAFTDCDYNSWYGKYVDWAAQNGIIKGYGGRLFKPNDMITREQMAAILNRFAGFIGTLPSSKDITLKYPDANAISTWAVDAALYCQTTGIISGRSGGMFEPKTTATRAEVATIIERFVESVTK